MAPRTLPTIYFHYNFGVDASFICVGNLNGAFIFWMYQFSSLGKKYMAQSSKREQLIKTSMELFYENGFHATGIDKILDEAGVSKKTMYQYFRSKDELIYASLRLYDSVFRNKLMKDIDATGKTPIDKLFGIFEIVEEYFQKDVYLGCLCTNAIAEYSAKESMVRDIATQCGKLTRDYFAQLAKEAGIKDYERLADQLYLILRGAVITTQVSQDLKHSKIAQRLARQLIEEARSAD